MKFKHGLTLAVLLLAAAFIGYAIWRAPQTEPATVRSLRTAQEADAPDGEPRKFANGYHVPPFDHRLDLFTGIQRFRIPVSDRFDYPLGSAHGALTYDAQSFWEMNEKRGGRHTGDDLNGIGGMNTDFGDPIYAVANGLVVYAGEPSPGWGKTILIAHRTQGGEILQSMYAHLESIAVPVSGLVTRGEKIGEVGTANGNYLAHLHFEMHAADGISLGGGYVNYRTNRLDPTNTVERLRHAPDDDLGSSVSEIVEQIERENIPLPTSF
jgi:murein DD-endopeptidase MepM/ murein hydrolase activator NlpD